MGVGAGRLSEAAVTFALIAVLPFWRDLDRTFAIGERGSDFRDDHPDLDADRDRILAALGLPLTSEATAATRLCATASRPAPGYLP